MYLRTVRANGHEYVRLVEGYRDAQGRVKQRVLSHLGRKDWLAPHLDTLVRILGGQPGGVGSALPESLSAPQAWDWGPFLVARALWKELGLEETLQAQAPRRKRSALCHRALVLVANRLTDPSSEHGLAGWLETDFVCDGAGRQWLPAWRSDTERKSSARPRVRVADGQLHGWYRTLDELLAFKTQIETNLFQRLKDLFSLEVELVFYDLTSTYFEGRGPAELARFGYSRDGKPRNRQVLLGLVMVQGWPIAHHVFEGNRRDEKTVPEVTEDLERRFGIKRVTFVEDRGMMSVTNLALIKKHGQGYIVGLQRRRREEIFRYIEQATGPWIDCPAGITARESHPTPKTRVQEVPSGAPGVRVLVVHSEEREAYERARRQEAQGRTREALEKLAQRVARGRLKAAEKIGAAAARILARRHGHRYFGWELQEGSFRFFEHPVHLKREMAYEGKYLLQTEEPDLSPVEVVSAYKELAEVERSFRELKDVIALRPIFHHKKERVQAHLLVATLGFLLNRALEKKLKAAAVDLSAKEALRALRTIRVVEFETSATQRKRCVTKGSPRARQILQALHLTELSPPNPEKGNWTVLL